jgi:hypothetical protein
MIRYPFDAFNVWATIFARDPKWRTKAQARTQKFLAKGTYEEKSSIWSDAKPAFIDLQHGKCAFCERQFESKEIGTIEHDLEHFRPKNAVLAWPTADQHPGLSYTFDTGAEFSTGYYWLAYDLLNYAACCKVCNTILKSNYFPIRANRAAIPTLGNVSGPKDLLVEEPLLCYPIGDWDEDPQSLITFDATVAVPVHIAGKLHDRARIIIDFFQLNEREILHKERARMISVVAPSFKKQASGTALTKAEQRVILYSADPWFPHSSCVRAFAKLWLSDAVRAEQVYEACLAVSLSPPSRP